MTAAPIVFRLAAAPSAVERDFLRLGERAPDGRSLQVNSRYLERDGRPWLPVMGEFHYSRCPAQEWARELRKMKAGGVDIVASYVFWNHHEAQPGVFDWSGQRDLRRFVELVRDLGLSFYLRPGPWVHGEARLGGFPDWLVDAGPVRCNDAGYLMHVARLYGEIGVQLRGLMFRDGGPVIGVQLENEYDRTGPGCGAEHIAALKQLAIDAGLQVPLYTVTGWPTLDIPPREVVPVSGAYADGFWQGAAGPLPPSGVFLFTTSRAIGEMGNVGGTPAAGKIDKEHYPFFLAEAGGGMHVSYHRRPVLGTDDVAATALVQIGSGANLYGYYMYHGGTNPNDGIRLNETQRSGYPNDVPVLGYDFRAPLGQYGQLRPSWGRLRTLHLFLAAFGEELATMDATLADGAGADPADRTQLRVAARGHAGGGFLFVNNHVRHHPMPAFDGVRFEVDVAGRTRTLPSRPVAIAPSAYFIWPLDAAIGAARLLHATVQPLTRWRDGDAWTWVAFARPGIAVELCFDPASVRAVEADAGRIAPGPEGLLLRCEDDKMPRRVRIVDADGVAHTIVLLDRDEADRCQRLCLHGRERLVLCEHALELDGDTLLVCAPADEAAQLHVYPADDLVPEGPLERGFARYTSAAALAQHASAKATLRLDRQEPPPLRLGPTIAWRGRAVPLAPDDAEYESHAARIELQLHDAPADGARVLLEIDYIGDAARLYADGVLVDDNFADGEPWFVGIDRFAKDGRWPAFELRIIPTRGDAAVFLEDKARQRIAAAARAAELLGARVKTFRTRRIEPQRR